MSDAKPVDLERLYRLVVDEGCVCPDDEQGCMADDGPMVPRCLPALAGAAHAEIQRLRERVGELK